MDTHRFDTLTRLLATRTHRRGALVGGLAAGLVALIATRGGRGVAQDAATPIASPAATPAATPGLLDVLSGTPPATDDPSAQARHADAGCCRTFYCFRTWSDMDDELLSTYGFAVCPDDAMRDIAQRHCDRKGADKMVCG